MGHLLSSIALMRPDAISVWNDAEVRKRLSWYRHVMLGEFPAKFILCRKIVAPPLEGELSEEALWVEHRRLSRALGDLISDITTGTIDPSKLKDQHPSLLDLKSELVNRMLEHCNFCEWNCRVNRAQGRIGFCRMDKAATVHSYFHHHGEEAPLIGVEPPGGRT